MKFSKIKNKLSKQERRVKEFTVKFSERIPRTKVASFLNQKTVQNRIKRLTYLETKANLFRVIITVTLPLEISFSGEKETYYSTYLKNYSDFTPATIRNKAVHMIENINDYIEKSKTASSQHASKSDYIIPRVKAVNFTFVYEKTL